MSMARISRIKQDQDDILAFFVPILFGTSFQCRIVSVCCTGILCTDTDWHFFSVSNSISMLYWDSLYWYCLAHFFSVKQYQYTVLVFFILILLGRTFQCQTVLVCCTGILCTDTVWHNFSVPNSISLLYWYSLYWYCLGKLFNAKQCQYVVLAFFILILFGNGFSVSTTISISNKGASKSSSSTFV